MAEEKKVKKGSKIKVDYEGRFEDGKVFDSSKHGDHSHPLEFTAGEGQVIKGFDDAIMGMKIGEEKEFKIQKEEAYGDFREELKQDVPRKALPPEQKPKVGMALMLSSPDGRQFPARIVYVNNEKITLDLNHPLAGKNLIFKINVVDIE